MSSYNFQGLRIQKILEQGSAAVIFTNHLEIKTLTTVDTKKIVAAATTTCPASVKEVANDWSPASHLFP